MPKRTRMVPRRNHNVIGSPSRDQAKIIVVTGFRYT